MGMGDTSFNDASEALPNFNLGDDSHIIYEENSLPSLPKDLELLPVLTVDEKPLKEQGPLFVRTDRYKVVLSNLDSISDYVHRGPEIIYMLKNLKKNADIEHKNYAKILEDIQRKLIYVDSVLFNEGVK